jgi:glutamyl-tRNA synthetase
MALDMTWFDQMESRIPKGEVRTRFAPSPTGYMHVGNRTALYTYLIAKSGGGKFILRIEDTDQNRLVEGAVDIIYSTLRQCGLLHDEGPDVGGPVGPYVQTQRRDLYGKYAELLIEKGGAYRCFCEKHEDAPEDGAIVKHSCDCAKLTAEQIREKLDAGVPYVIRQIIPEGRTNLLRRGVRGDHRSQQRSGRAGAHQVRRPSHLQFRQRHRRPPHGHHPRGQGL